MSPRAPRVLWSSFLLAAAVATTAIGCDDGFDPSGSPDHLYPQAAHPGPWSVFLRTELAGTYLTAKNAGGGAVDATGAEAREWENFRIIDQNGGDLVDGDWVHLLAYDGHSYLQAVGGGGAGIDAAAQAPGDTTSFQIFRVAGAGKVAIGDTIALRAKLNPKYVTAKNGGGSTVAVTAPALLAWEHFQLSGVGAIGDPPPPPPPPPPPAKRVVGYLPNWYGSYADWANKVDFSKVTQINLAFALGDANGNLQLAPDSQVDAFVTAAHAKGVKVFPSLCGGGGDDKIAPHYQPGKVDAFVDKIIAYVVKHKMDGIDVDVEAPNKMGAAYDTFIAKLKAKAAPLGLPVTAAVAPWMQSGMSNATLKSFDFITVMSYDNAGTWTGAGAHSSYQQAVDALNFYEAKGVPRAKIVLGVPFYGYCWGNCGGPSSKYVLYKDILAKFPWASTVDWIDQGGAKYSFNGVGTMKAKTQLANGYGGIMIWELAGDVKSTNADSLLKAVDDAN